MSPEAQRVAVAELCGWKIERARIQTGWNLIAPEGKLWTSFWQNSDREPTLASCYTHLPDYLVDLNAMHEAEKHLLKVHAKNYCRYLGASSEEYQEELYFYRVVTATAAQRAEAFVRCLGKWNDAK